MLSMWVAATVRPILGCKVENHVLPDNKGHYQGSFNTADIDSRCESTKWVVAFWLCHVCIDHGRQWFHVLVQLNVGVTWFPAALHEPDLTFFAMAFCLLARVLFSDIDLLAWAPYTIGTVHSNVDELALRIGMCVYGRKETTYLDAEDWDVVTVYPRVW